jgi:hypothetical protein
MSTSITSKKTASLLQDGFRKVNRFHTSLIVFYTKLLNGRAHKFIGAYLLISLILSIGLLQIQFSMDTENLAVIRNSPSQRDAKILKNTFGSKQHEARKIIFDFLKMAIFFSLFTFFFGLARVLMDLRIIKT